MILSLVQQPSKYKKIVVLNDKSSFQNMRFEA